MLSIIVATYNAEKTIYKCIDSIQKQKIDDLEIIVIDGASTDGTVDIIEGFRDSKIKIISESDRGIYDAWNKGLKCASGNWICFIGADDFYYEGALASLMEYADNNAPFIYGTVACEGADGNVSGRLGGPWVSPWDSRHQYIESDLCFPVMGSVYSKSFFGNRSFDINLEIVADADLILKSLKQWKGIDPVFSPSISPVLEMGYGGVSTSPNTYLVSLKESFLVRRRNGLSNINYSLLKRAIKMYCYQCLKVIAGKKFSNMILKSYYRVMK
ncbi:glycosyltransferase family 2 protein [Parendozoicomonas sp. Alg238-R29]|uniref:glycosyltransferase family 2 protein n=1 Tax=Parendozoicomonas sp. Alg238-R29 TaxID=2993446 RepID=UPI00248EDDD6|nr:glycosyltransferase family 2 protein [Parendozoicomonas sp. Alg238-R29]